MIITTLMVSSLELGLLYTLCVMGAWLTSVVMHFDDLTIEGSFALGGALSARMILAGYSPLLCCIVALAAGACTGMVTGLLNTFGGVSPFFSGVAVTTALFSVNLVLATANLTIGMMPTIFKRWALLPYIGHKLLLLAIIASIALLFLRWLLQTQLGLFIRATGSNQTVVHAMGKRVGFFMIIALMIANSFHALAGCLFTQYVGFFSIWSGIGILLIATSAILIAKMFIRPSLRIGLPGMRHMFGSCIYQLLIALAITMSPYAQWNNALRALLLVILIQIRRWRTTHA